MREIKTGFNRAAAFWLAAGLILCGVGPTVAADDVGAIVGLSNQSFAENEALDQLSSLRSLLESSTDTNAETLLENYRDAKRFHRSAASLSEGLAVTEALRSGKVEELIRYFQNRSTKDVDSIIASFRNLPVSQQNDLPLTSVKDFEHGRDQRIQQAQSEEMEKLSNKVSRFLLENHLKRNNLPKERVLEGAEKQDVVDAMMERSGMLELEEIRERIGPDLTAEEGRRLGMYPTWRSGRSYGSRFLTDGNLLRYAFETYLKEQVLSYAEIWSVQFEIAEDLVTKGKTIEWKENKLLETIYTREQER